MKGLQFRLYTENLNTDKIISKANKIGLDSFTYYRVDGKYKGINELTLIIECVIGENWNYGTDKIRQAFKNLADYCKLINNQETILLTEQEVNYELY